ncbi:NACHT domain-containing protein [Brevundimonas sp.]|uniref:NACHT domain-containing protein n=1 Tax=Brevundimonas sp. TaxID=1871086 RepID=UPI002FC8D699
MNFDSWASDLGSAEPWLVLRAFVLFLVALLLLLTAAVKGGSAVIGLMRDLRARRLEKRLEARTHIKAFLKEDIRKAVSGYIEPDCSQRDPANEEDLSRIADVREPIMRSVMRHVEHGGDRRFMLLLAESGMGKTTFCLNLFARLEKKFRSKELYCAVIPLGRENVVPHIRKMTNQSDTILILDALDEDAAAIKDSFSRINDLMKVSADFRAVIITCRSQFFPDDASIPNDTGVAVIAPRRAGESGSFKFYKLYLLPFDQAQVRAFIRRQFPLTRIASFGHRSKAHYLLKTIQELSVRPMLLSLVPDLIKARKHYEELYDLYDFMVRSWLDRESRWIEPEKLLDISKKLAVYIYAERPLGSGDRVTVDELAHVAGIRREDANWKHLTARSLLNRNSEGEFKFAHRSIMEFLFVRSAIDRDERCFTVPWTDFMKQLFVSWGWTEDQQANPERAVEILSSDLRAAEMTPLSAPLPQPAIVSVTDLTRKRVTSYAGRYRNDRIIPTWRKESLGIFREKDTLNVYDREYDLTWRFTDLDSVSERNIFRNSFADLARIESSGDGFRLPSAAEFVSLVDASVALNEPFLAKDELYWLGDQLGRARYLVASLGGPDRNDELLTPLPPIYQTSRGGIPVRLYELALRPRDKQRGVLFNAMTVLVKPGGVERAWFDRKRIAKIRRIRPA